MRYIVRLHMRDGSTTDIKWSGIPETWEEDKIKQSTMSFDKTTFIGRNIEDGIFQKVGHYYEKEICKTQKN